MGKGIVFVVLFCLITISLFVTFLKLLIAITPPPYKVDPVDNTSVVVGDSEPENNRYVDLEQFPHGLKVEYGLAKIYDKNYPTKVNYTYILLNPRRDLEKFNYSNDNIVLPPVWPRESDMRETLHQNYLMKRNSTKMNRRSVRKDFENHTDENPLEGLVVKVINADDPQIEIKYVPGSYDVKNATKFNNADSEINVDINTTEELKLKIADDKIIIFNMTNNLIQFLSKIIDFDIHKNLLKDRNLTNV